MKASFPLIAPIDFRTSRQVVDLLIAGNSALDGAKMKIESAFQYPSCLIRQLLPFPPRYHPANYQAFPPIVSSPAVLAKMYSWICRHVRPPARCFTPPTTQTFLSPMYHFFACCDCFTPAYWDRRSHFRTVGSPCVFASTF